MAPRRSWFWFCGGVLIGEADETSASAPTRIDNLMKAAMADELSLSGSCGGLIMKGV